MILLRVVIDTSVLLDDCTVIDQYDEIILCSSVLEELDGLKKNNDLRYKAQSAIKMIEANDKKITFEVKDIYEGFPDGWDCTLRDNKIVMCACENSASLLTNDINMRNRARVLNVPVIVSEVDLFESIYKGYKEVVLTDEELAYHYQNPENHWGLLNNQYLIIMRLHYFTISPSHHLTISPFHHLI